MNSPNKSTYIYVATLSINTHIIYIHSIVDRMHAPSSIVNFNPCVFVTCVGLHKALINGSPYHAILYGHKMCSERMNVLFIIV